MSTVTYDTFFKEVIPYVRDCPEFVAINAIRNACIEFCERSLYLRQILTPFALVQGQAEYDLDIDLGTSVASIIAANLGFLPIKPESEEVLQKVVGADWRTRPGPVRYMTQDTHNTIRLVLVPDGGETELLSMTVALRPMMSSVKIDQDVYERWAEVIGWGARARLHDTPGQQYSNEDAAKKFRMWFESGIGDAKIAANRALGRTDLVVRPPRFI